MRIKSLELNGFKSFVDKTALKFGPGTTGIVGPNGCGKSNVVDAIRWAMGEQSARRLRGKGMDDVIFGGSEGIAPVGMAEVVLTFDNSEGDGPAAFESFSEIQIARRLYRSGESEYLINKTGCRLRDVQDFFRDSGVGAKGYTIVEQGRIAEIVSIKPEERRILIEEAAGIGKYKARRREAESKIASTEQNLVRVNDVLTEIKRQISSIERQARKAARYKRLRESVRVLELSLAVDERSEFLEHIDGARGRLTALGDAVTASEAQLAERELEIQRKRLELAECERVLSHGSEALLSLRTDIKECEGHIQFGRRERESLAELITGRGEELVSLREQLATNDAELTELRAELESEERALESEREVLASAEAEASEARQRLEELTQEREAANTALVEVLTHIARAEDRHASLEDRRAEQAAKMRNADEGLEVGQSEASRAESEQRSLEEGLRNLLAERDRLMTALRTALETQQSGEQRHRAAGEALREARELRETRRARLASLREVIERREDIGAGTRHLLEDGSLARQDYGLLALVRDVLEVDRDAERAVEALLMDRAEAIVVDKPSGAISMLERLRTARTGRGVFVAMPPPSPEPLGFVPLGESLLSRVRPRAGFEGLARQLLGGANLVSDLAEVLEVYGAGRIPTTFVTPAGDVLTPDGVVRGGGFDDDGGGLIARQRETRELEAEVAELDARVASLEAEFEGAEAASSRTADEIDNLRNRHHTAALAVANHEKDLERSEEKVKALGEAHEGRVAERSEILADGEFLTSESERMTRLLADSRGDRATRQRELDALGLRIGSVGRDVTRLETTATERRVEHGGRAEKRDRLAAECERVGTAAREAREWITRRETEVSDAETRREELAAAIESSQATLEQRLREEEAARASTDEKREAFERTSGEVTAIEDRSRELRNQINSQREAVGKADIAVRETELKLGHLEDTIREKWQIDLAGWTLPPLEIEEPKASELETESSPTDESAGEAVGDAGGGAVEGAPTGSEGEASTAAEATPGQPGEPLDAGAAEAEEPAPDAAREARQNAELARLPQPERRAKLQDLRRKMEALGDVNLGAIEEHEELSERFRFLSEQKADLDGTLESLRDAISRINRTSRRRFREAFEEISKRFSENFPRLFRGGKASLALTESEDVLEAGIDIMAQPPGKRLQNVNLLSGGEKTLTAIALLVAVFQVRPSPFFLLDEVDAALDDANVGRFNEIVKELSETSQFLLITHNKRTIEIADRLYGVTMERKGVSKLVSVELTT